MSAILDFIRSEEPKFRDVPDEKLSAFLAVEEPRFLQNEEFRQEHLRLNPPESLQPVLSSAQMMPRAHATLVEQVQKISEPAEVPGMAEVRAGSAKAVEQVGGAVGSVLRAATSSVVANFQGSKRKQFNRYLAQVREHRPSLPARRMPWLI